MEKLPTDRTRGDHALAAARAAGSAVPFVGGAIEEIIGYIKAPLDKRRDEFFQSLADGIARLEQEGRLLRETLYDNEAFVDAVARGVHAAIRTGQEEKRTALRNAVLNAALDMLPDEAERQIFFELVERLTAWHLRILRAFEDPVRWNREHNVNYRPSYSSSNSAFLELAFPELASRKDFYLRVWTDLGQAGLVAATGLNGMMTETGWQSSRTTEAGNRFLRFIEDP